MIRCEVIDNERRLDELESEWHALWLRTEGGVFQSYHWIKAWWLSS